jgi:hypothetical protein
LLVIDFILFDYSEIGEFLHLQANSQMVLVSYPEGGILGVNSACGKGDIKKAGRQMATRLT